MDLRSLLLTIASLSASFVAILGGFIASRLITISSERSNYSSQLQEVENRLRNYKGVRYLHNEQLDKEDAIQYIYNHMSELVAGERLEDVYEEEELQSIDFVDLEPLWKRAKEIKSYFDECLKDANCEFNSDMIPVALAEEYNHALFEYEFCQLYAAWGFEEYDFENIPFREKYKGYETDRQKALEYTIQIMVLESQKEQYIASLNALREPAGMKVGLALFISFSFLNIILPLTMSLFCFTEHASIFVAIVSVILLATGLAATFIYLAWLLKWREEKNKQRPYSRWKEEST